MPNEIELKLRIAQHDVEDLQRHPLVLRYQATQPISHQLTSIYYDTPDFALKNANTSLRVRHMDDGWFQAVKSAGNVINGLHTRKEWEDVLSNDQPDFNKIASTEMGEFFSNPTLQKALRPIFVTEMLRTEWQLYLPDGHIEMALDVGHVSTFPDHLENQAKARAHNICEIELELKQGSQTILAKFANALRQDIALQEENISKAGIGYALLGVA